MSLFTVDVGAVPNIRRRARRAATAALAAVSIAVLAACSSTPSSTPSDDPEPGDEGGTIAFSFLYSEIPVAGALKGFAHDKAAELGYELLTDNIQGGKVDEQIASVDNFIAQGVDALVVQHLDSSPYGGLIERARAAGIPYITYFTPHPEQDGSVTFRQEDSAAALSEDAAAWINANLDGTGKVLLLALTNDEGSRATTAALRSAIETETGAEIVAVQEGLDQATAMQVTEDTLQAHPDVNVVLGWNDGSALGAAEAFSQAGIDPAGVYIGSMESGEQGLQALVDGNEYLKALSVLSIRMLGEAIAQVAHNVITGEGETEVDVPLVLIHPGQDTEINEFLAEYGD